MRGWLYFFVVDTIAYFGFRVSVNLKLIELRPVVPGMPNSSFCLLLKIIIGLGLSKQKFLLLVLMLRH